MDEAKGETGPNRPDIEKVLARLDDEPQKNAYVHRMPTEEEVRALLEYIGRAEDLLRRIVGRTGPFICGHGGEVDGRGLHEEYFVCPQYGADHRCTALYKQVDK